MANVEDPHLEKHKEEITQQQLQMPTTHVTNELAQEEFKVVQKTQKKFSQVINTSNEVLTRIKTVFPFDLFPDTLTVDPVKVNYRCNILFSSGYTESIPVDDIVHVDVETAVLFAALRISYISYPTRHIIIKPLWKKDAEKARDIIAGLMVTSKQQIDVAKIVTSNEKPLETMGNSHI